MPGEARRRRLRALFKMARTEHSQPEALERAFVHESAARELRIESNERLEFLGDSILGTIVATWLYDTFVDEAEGTLTLRKAKIVNDAALAATARRIGFPDLVVLGAGMRNADGAHNQSVLADAFEAFIAALYVTSGWQSVRDFVVREHIANVDQSAALLIDAKTRLQHIAQERFATTPEYRDESAGTAQIPAFHSQVFVNGRSVGAGRGPSKKIAQQLAAEAALSALQAASP